MKKIFSLMLIILIAASSFPVQANSNVVIKQKINQFISKLQNKEIFDTCIKNYYYAAQHVPALQALINESFEDDEDNEDLILAIVLLSLLDIALQKYTKNSLTTIDLASEYIKCGNINSNERNQIEESIYGLMQEQQRINSRKYPNITLTNTEEEVIADVMYDLNFFFMGQIYGKEFYPPLIDRLIEFLMQDYGDYYKNMPFPPEDFLKSLGLNKKEIREMQLGTTSFLYDAVSQAAE
jgi:hypothetical protein